MYWYLQVLKKYAVFHGRARRKEYWMFALVDTIIAIAIGFMARQIGDVLENIMIWAYFLALLIPRITVTVRRLHDIGRSGWWVSLWLVPYTGVILNLLPGIFAFLAPIGIVFFLLAMVTDSDPYANEYGPNPKE